MRWDTIYFDIDDTLISYDLTFKKAIIYTFLKLKEQWGISKEINELMWYHVFKRNSDILWPKYEKKEWTRRQYRFRRFYDTMREFQIEANESMVQTFQLYFDKVVSRFAVPMEGMREFLIDLKSRDVQLGIISNGKKKIQIEKINTLGFQQFFSSETIIISEDVEVEKPNPKIFEIALERMENYHFPPLYIGDSWNLDIVGASQANWDTIYFNTRNDPPTSKIDVINICYNVKELHTTVFSSNAMKEF